jgi:hypothetical protein
VNYPDTTNDPTWIGEMVTYFGFPPSTDANVTQPVLQSLNEQFAAMLEQAHEDMLKYT